MIFGMIEKERFEKVLEKGSKLFNTSKEDFQRTMETDFMAAYVTGYYGHGVLMEDAAKRYFEEIETELFVDIKITDDTFDGEVIEAEAVAVESHEFIVNICGSCKKDFEVISFKTLKSKIKYCPFCGSNKIRKEDINAVHR